MDIQTPKTFGQDLNFQVSIDDNKYNINIKSYELEVDFTGRIREKLHLKKGKVSFDQGINDLIEYITLENEKSGEEHTLVENSFKCPIIFKNFDEADIPENKTIITEIKSGFDIASVKKQLDERITIIKNCLFNAEERPTFFIGVIYLDSKNVSKLKNLLNKEEFAMEENALIISIVDFHYCGIDASYAVNNDYILYKKLEETRNEMNNGFTNLNKKIDTKFNVLDGKINKLDKKIDDLIKALLMSNPNFNNFIEKTIQKEEGKEEEKKRDC